MKRGVLWQAFLWACFLCFMHVEWARAYREEPLDVGDLVFRDSNGKIYGRDGDLCKDAARYPGHVGIYIGQDKIVHALGYFEEGKFVGEVKETPLSLVPGVETFYSNKTGKQVHYPLGAKTHRNLRNNPDATIVRSR